MVERAGDITEIRKGLGASIRRHRQSKGWTQATLAEAVGSSEQALSKVERGDGSPSLATLAAIAAALEVTIRDLFPAPPPPSRGTPAAKLAARLESMTPAEIERVEAVISAMLAR